MTTPIAVCDLIAHIESSGNPYAYRFEPIVYKNLSVGSLTPAHLAIVQNIMRIHSCSQSSAMVIYSSSYGLYQIMGFNMYGLLGVEDSIFKFCNNPVDQLVAFNKLRVSMKLDGFSVSDLANDANDRMIFAQRYNGSLVYEDAIVAALQYYKIPVTA